VSLSRSLRSALPTCAPTDMPAQLIKCVCFLGVLAMRHSAHGRAGHAIGLLGELRVPADLPRSG